MRILVIEDEPGIADFLERGLEAEGYAVTSVGDGERGEAIARAEEVALVVLDVMLPGRDGFQVLEGIRRDKPTLPVVLLTARDQVRTRSKVSTRALPTTCTKPFSFDELVARIRAHLRVPSQAQTTVLEGGDIKVSLLERRVDVGGAGGEPLDEGVRPARVLHAAQEPGAVARADPERGVGLRLRSGHERRGGLRGLPAPEARPGWAARRRSTRCARWATGSPIMPS